MAWSVYHRHPHRILLDRHVVPPVALLTMRALALNPSEAYHLAVAVLEAVGAPHLVDLHLPCHHRVQRDEGLRHEPLPGARVRLQ